LEGVWGALGVGFLGLEEEPGMGPLMGKYLFFSGS